MQQRPRMRPVEAFAVRDGQKTQIGLRDRTGLVQEVLLITPPVLFVLSQLDGETTLEEVVHRFGRQYGVILTEPELRDIIDSLDANLFLDTPHFHQWSADLKRQYLALPARPSSCAGGAYPAKPEQLAAGLAALLARNGAAPAPTTPPRGLVVPHIDYGRGADCYAAGFAALAAAGPAETYIILGTNHFGGDRYYTATRMPFDTPLGRVEVDQARLDRIAAAYGDDLFADEFDHAREHSIELSVVMLAHLFGAGRIRIIPILCGGFEMLNHHDMTPDQVDSVGTMVGVLSQQLEESQGRVFI